MAGTSLSPAPAAVTTTNPAVNTEISETVPAARVWDVQSISITLVTDANVANRDVVVTIEDGSGNEIYNQAVGASITASLTGKIFMSKWGGSQPSDASPVFYLTLPCDLQLPAGFIIKTTTAALQVGDDYGAPVIIAQDYTVSTN